MKLVGYPKHLNILRDYITVIVTQERKSNHRILHGSLVSSIYMPNNANSEYSSSQTCNIIILDKTDGGGRGDKMDMWV